MTKDNLIYYNVNYQEAAYNLKIKNYDWEGFKQIKETADWVPGGRYYPLLIGKPERENAGSNPKVFQSYSNADRFEWVLTQIFKNMDWNPHYTGGFNPGIGVDEADLHDDNGNIDAKIYWDYNSIINNVFNLFMNVPIYSLDYWYRAVNKLFHSDNDRLAVYDNAAKRLYFIFRPKRIYRTIEEIYNDNLVVVTDMFVPNVIATENGYAIDWAEQFQLNILDENEF